MSLESWMSTREPAPPDRLRARLAELAQTEPGAGEGMPGALVTRAVEVVARLLREGQTSRHGALELLAADALVTYAFEAQADEPAELEARCIWAMAHLCERPDAV
ncbi:MAG: hypothetical protein ABIZ91_03530 [Gemmatimonadaceae bacterium]